MWVPSTHIVRGHWLATDASKVQVHPPSEGQANWIISFPSGEREVTVELQADQEDAAFHYAAGVRKTRAN